MGKGNFLEILETFFKKNGLRAKKLASQIINLQLLRPFEIRGVIQKQNHPIFNLQRTITFGDHNL